MAEVCTPLSGRWSTLTSSLDFNIFCLCCHFLSQLLVLFVFPPAQPWHEDILEPDSVCVRRFVLSTVRECERQKDMISFVAAALSEELKTHRHTHNNTCLDSSNSLFIHYRLEGSETQGEGCFKAHFPYPETISHSGPGAYMLVPEWRLEGLQSHNTAVFDRSVIGCVSPPQSPDLLCPSESTPVVQQKTHTHAPAPFHFMSVESRGQMWSFTQRPGLWFPPLKGLKTPVFHTSSFTHTPHTLLPAFKRLHATMLGGGTKHDFRSGNSEIH